MVQVPTSSSGYIVGIEYVCGAVGCIRSWTGKRNRISGPAQAIAAIQYAIDFREISWSGASERIRLSNGSALQSAGAGPSGSNLQLDVNPVDRAASIQIAFINDLSRVCKRSHRRRPQHYAVQTRRAVDHLGRRIAHIVDIPHHLVDEVASLLRYVHGRAFGIAALLHLDDAAHYNGHIRPTRSPRRSASRSARSRVSLYSDRRANQSFACSESSNGPQICGHHKSQPAVGWSSRWTR